MTHSPPTHYAWFDTEFTSLDLDEARLIQVALVVSDTDLNPVVPNVPPPLIPSGCIERNGVNVYLPLPRDWEPQPFHLEEMADVLERCRASSTALAQADAFLAAWLDACIGPPAESIGARPVMAGNSVHNDWFLARRDMPEFARRLHYRLLDASSFKSEWLAHFGGESPVLLDKDDREALRAVFPSADVMAAAHDAYYDAQASLAEQAWYRRHLTPGTID